MGVIEVITGTFSPHSPTQSRIMTGPWDSKYSKYHVMLYFVQPKEYLCHYSFPRCNLSSLMHRPGEQRHRGPGLRPRHSQRRHDNFRGSLLLCVEERGGRWLRGSRGNFSTNRLCELLAAGGIGSRLPHLPGRRTSTEINPSLIGAGAITEV